MLGLECSTVVYAAETWTLSQTLNIIKTNLNILFSVQRLVLW